jgi:outer membrane lipoprotein-sorting protein
MRWEYASKLFVVNERDAWLYIPDDREATHANASAANDPRLPFLFLLGQSNLSRNFASIEMANEKDAVAGSVTLRLVPKRRDLGITEVYISADVDGRISKIKSIDQRGSVSEITLSDIRENYTAPPGSFDFRPPPEVKVRQAN